MTGRHISVAVLVASLVIEVADISIICHGLVKLNHRVGRLQDVQLWEVGTHAAVLGIIEILGELILTYESAGIYVTARFIHTAYRHQQSQDATVATLIYTCHTEVSDSGTLLSQLKPVDFWAAIYHESCDILSTFEGQRVIRQLRQIAEFKRLKGCRKHHFDKRRTLCEAYTCQRSVRCAELLHLGIPTEVDAGKLCTLQAIHLQYTEILAAVNKQVVERCLRSLTAYIERSESRAVTEIEGLQDGVAHIREVETHHAAGSINILRVIDDEVSVEGELHLRAFSFCEHRTLLWRTRCISVAEIIPLAGCNLNLAVVSRELVAEVAAEAVLAVSTADVLTIEQGKSVLDCVASVSISATLHRIEIVIIGSTRCCLHAINERSDILEDTILIIYTLAPVTHLFLVEHVQHIFERHITSDLVSHLTQLVRTATYQVPQHGIVTSEGIRADTVVESLVSDCVCVLQYGVVADTEERIHIVRQEHPVNAIPRTEHHVLRS